MESESDAAEQASSSSISPSARVPVLRAGTRRSHAFGFGFSLPMSVFLGVRRHSVV
jgi:hypothetical protein